MLRVVLAVVAASLALSEPFAQERVGGWSVSRVPDAAGTCTASRAYADPADNGAANKITLALAKPKEGAASLTVTLFYEGWEWDAGETVSAELLAGKQSLVKDARWTAPSPNELSGAFGGIELLLWGLANAGTLTLRFDESAEAEFDIPDAGLAVAALRGCGTP